MNLIQFLRKIPTEVITIFLIFGLPVIGRILKKLADQAKLRRQALQRERDELERLRTGRAPQHEASATARAAQVSGASARATLEEMAAKRRAQIEQMRAQGQGRPGPMVPPIRPQPVPRTTTPPMSQPTVATTTVHLPGGVILEVPISTKQAPAQARQPGPQRSRPAGTTTSGARAQAPQQRRPQPKADMTSDQYDKERARQVKVHKAAAIEQSQRQEEQSDEDRRRRLAAANVEEAAPAPAPKRKVDSSVIRGSGAGLLGIAMTRGDWRRAFIMQEVLGTPVGLRQSGQGGFPR